MTFYTSSVDRPLLKKTGQIKTVNLIVIESSLTSRVMSQQSTDRHKHKQLAISSLFNGLELLSAASDKAKIFAENFSKNSNLNDSGISLPVFPSRTNMKLHISVTPTMVKKIITNFHLSQTSGPDCVPVAVLKNCEPELS